MPNLKPLIFISLVALMATFDSQAQGADKVQASNSVSQYNFDNDKAGQSPAQFRGFGLERGRI